MYTLTEQLTTHRIAFSHYSYYAPAFLQRWEHRFVPLTADEKEAIFLHSDRYSCGYLWHVFSYEKRPHEKGAAANESFTEHLANTYYVFGHHTNDVLIIHEPAKLIAAMFADCEDIYVVDQAFTWSYVVTHERSLGPYFSHYKSNAHHL